ncbi:glycoside hydrolase family 25 protein [Nitratireductor mangrovi]|uniref:Glycoside hydrolase family 25 protein n=1 Tax=Nitratireductor mangrovi TaxID=2599600 RepID=A0A5B8KUS4_9HYPH|nr:GH25 family lysozyme [Nitratireductor mangrovi]QDY99332.1 glycoside hydrolase family 25 protein [Nitratireductor mangrovi]
MRRLAGLAMATLLAACSTVSYDLGDIAPQSSSATVTVSNPRFGDRDPHAWRDRAPWTYPVHGTDVSKYQTEIDWPKAKASGISFAFIKATEGGDRVDDYFNRNWKAAKAAGVPRSAYHFYYFCRPAIEQARWFIRNVPRDPSALPPVLDMEWNPFSPTCTLRPPAATVRAEMRIFLEAVERHYGKKPIIYTSIDFFDDNGLANFKGYPYWLRSVADHPDDRYGRHPFLFWQYTGTGIVPGIKGDADINVFNGSASAWRKWLAANTK